MAASTTQRRIASPAAILAVVGFGVFVAADDLTVVSTMLRPIIGDLGIVLPDGLDDAAWIVNAYLIAYVAVMPFAGRLSDIVGRRKVFVGAMTLFMIGSFLIPLTSSLGPFLAARVLTALGGGALVPVSLAVVGDAYEESKRARALGVLGAIDTLGWVWGPLYGALIIRFLEWRWQFWLNIPLAMIGIALAWWALAAYDKPVRSSRIDWWGTATLTTALVTLNLALLGSADIQSVSGLDELTGGSNSGTMRWLYLVALLATVAFVIVERRVENPLLDLSLFRGRNLTSAVIVNFLTGAALVIAMVNVPLFVNIVELEVARSAVIAGLLLSALTATMALTSYLGGRMAERTWYQPPVLVGLAAAATGFFLMGLIWSVDTAYAAMALQLALLGAGIGLTIAPTSAAVVDAAEPDRRGTAASLVIVFRLMGLSVGLSALTAWGLHRFNQLRGSIELPPIDDPGYADAALRAQTELTTSALAETFLAAAVVVSVAFIVALFMTRPSSPAPDHPEVLPMAIPEQSTDDPTPPTGMNAFLYRHLVPVIAVLAGIALIALIAAVILAGRLGSVSDELTTTQADLERVQAGTAIFAAQITTFQEEISALAPGIDVGLSEAIDGLDTFATSTITFDVEIDESVPINTEIVLEREIVVPIRTSIPIEETVDTTITIQGPFGVDIPIDVTVPVDIDVPIDLDVAIPVNETIPINTTVPVTLSVPITVEVANTELASLATSLRTGLVSFRDVLVGLG